MESAMSVMVASRKKTISMRGMISILATFLAFFANFIG
jgi:hypothetical protein